MAQPKLLTWNPKQLSIMQKLQAGQTPAEIAESESVSKATVTKVSNALKKGQSPANPYIKPIPKHKKFPEAKDTTKKTIEKIVEQQIQSKTGDEAPEVDTPAGAHKSVMGNASLLVLKQIPANCTLTPIMINARYAAVKKFGWREDMPWDNFFDTCLVWLFRYWGVSLQGYYDIDKDGNAISPKPASEKPSGNGGSDKDKAAALGYALVEMMKGSIEATKAS